MAAEETEEKNSPLTTDFLSPTPRQRGKRTPQVAVVVVIGLLLIGAGWFLLGRSRGGQEVTPSPTPVAEATPEPTPEPELRRADLRLQVLNGIGTAGVAGAARDYLEGLGYENIEIGNADSFDYEETVIRIKKDKGAYLDMLREDLEGEYDVARASETLGEDSEFDAVVIIGGPKPSPTPTPTPSPTPSPSPTPESTGSAVPSG